MKKALIAFGIFILVIVVLGIFAQGDMHIEREIIIDRPRDQVFTYLKSIKNADAWSPWSKLDPQMSKEYRGVDGSVGSVGVWSGNNEVGAGEQELKSLVEGERIDFELRFTRPMKGTSTSYYTTEALSPTQTKVKWGMLTKGKFPMTLICLFMNMTKKMNEIFDSGLASLKAKLEK